jgi:hypothetical protein
MRQRGQQTGEVAGLERSRDGVTHAWSPGSGLSHRHLGFSFHCSEVWASGAQSLLRLRSAGGKLAEGLGPRFLIEADFLCLQFLLAVYPLPPETQLRIAASSLTVLSCPSHCGRPFGSLASSLNPVSPPRSCCHCHPASSDLFLLSSCSHLQCLFIGFSLHGSALSDMFYPHLADVASPVVSVLSSLLQDEALFFSLAIRDPFFFFPIDVFLVLIEKRGWHVHA